MFTTKSVGNFRFLVNLRTMETSGLNLEGQIPETEIQNRKIVIPLDGIKSSPKRSLPRRGRGGYASGMESISVGSLNVDLLKTSNISK